MSALAISPTTAMVNQNGTVQFVASGGTGPYSFSVAPGAIGTIDPVTGIYTAPPQTNIVNDVVQLTDSEFVPVTVTAQVTVNSPLTLISQIIQNELGLSAGQVYIYNEKINVPTDSKLYVAIGIQSAKVYSNNRKYCPIPMPGVGLQQVQTTRWMAVVSVDILSKGQDALNRKEEVTLALHSDLAQSYQETFGFKIASQPTAILNISGIDGSAIPNRFTFSLPIQYKIMKTKPVLYYDTFSQPTLSVQS